ncbi:MAG: ribosome-binding factor A [Beggiatoa sp. IS2]|nr:MAG: ribosome-binding factor A [Beggiatoa sp. IS2]
MPKEFSRNCRVSELIRRELSDILRREINEPSWGLLTLTAVTMPPDLKTAQVFISLLGGITPAAQVLRHLNNRAGVLRYQLSQRLTLRITPRLQFQYDDSIEQGNRMCTLINSLVAPKTDDHE